MFFGRPKLGPTLKLGSFSKLSQNILKVDFVIKILELKINDDYKKLSVRFFMDFAELSLANNQK